MTIMPLGIDNVLFTVADLEAAIGFYEAVGLKLKFRVAAAHMALFAVGGEEPGLVIRQGEDAGGGKFWVEVVDAVETRKTLEKLGYATVWLETATGFTVETRDPSGNVLGFADYRKRPELARKPDRA